MRLTTPLERAELTLAAAAATAETPPAPIS